jgi:hypothetical protein
MERVRFITHNGKQVLVIDYRGITSESEIMEVIDERKRLVTSQSKGSVLTIALLGTAHFGKEALTKVKEANVWDKPFVRRAALVGGSPSQEAAIEAVDMFAHRNWGRFDTLEEALDWVVSDDASGKAKP